MTRALKQSQHGSIIGSGTSSAAPGGSPDPPAALAGPRPFRHLIGLDLAIQAEQLVAIQAEQLRSSCLGLDVAIQADQQPLPPAALAGPRPFRHLIGLDLAIQAEQLVAIQAEQQVAIQAERLRRYRIGRSYFTQLG
ncbi:MAG: hypothetical protein M5U01_08090 [Ardenticatenaceae bacterium]|nr:hypothetical protein [Ardenticatenaceae bacterium]